MANQRAEWLNRYLAWARKVRLRSRLAIGLALACMVAAVATYAALTGSLPIKINPATMSALLIVDLVLLMALTALIVQRVINIFITRRKNQAGSRLHVRMVTVFTMLAVLPSLIVASFAAVFFYYGVQTWFSDRVRTAVNESVEVAEAYLKEHQQVLRADALAMANDINREAYRLADNPSLLSQIVSTQASLRSLTEALVFDGSGRVLARSGLTFSLSFEPVTDEMMQRARNGDVVLLISEGDDRVRALVRLDNFVDGYLFVGRLVEPKVLNHMTAAQKAFNEYALLEGKRSGVQTTITLIFIVVALMLLMAAIWFGLNFATRLVRPISDLINAAERVRAGDLASRVKEPEDEENDDELVLLGRAFNRMTSQLESQRSELIDANRQIDMRRQFTEAMLAAVPAGVIGLNALQQVTLINNSARDIFKLDVADSQKGIFLTDMIPELTELMANLQPTGRVSEGQMELRRPGQTHRTLLVRVAAEASEGHTAGYVLTFDDVSDLVSAQRKAAWADVARRIAHEIKNPLTPIQLSAERIRRKYKDEIVTDPEVFDTCTNTIIRQVDDIGRMVDEFSMFARMPTPSVKLQDVRDICRQTFFLQNSGRHDIDFHLDLPSSPVILLVDHRQLAQAITNLMKNAAESIEGRAAAAESKMPRGIVVLSVQSDEQHVTISIADNGKGLPVEDRHRLTEPYVTTRTKGTGLGLAIVKKIMEDHRGDLKLEDRDGGGAVVKLIFPQPAIASPEMDLATATEMTHTQTVSSDSDLPSHMSLDASRRKQS